MTDDDANRPEPVTPIEGRKDFQREVLAALEDGAAAGVPQLWMADLDFDAWPLGQPAVVDALARWASSRRRLTLLAADYALFPQRFPRWIAWRQQWSHVVQCLVVQEEFVAQLPCLLFVPDRVAVRLFDRERHRGRVLREPADLLRCRELVDALSQRSEEGFPVTTLGL
ncbi:hypothetical protein [uncultured Methylibium sp.]|uniref:hypothetical protein n=1 Tax=uncultured Methylibium sp. TaxID=381093 RepID=UPI0025F08D16|nr:hypothetical protein [uncultured Methylibium sp.]